jgi:hypothetical protein
LLPGIAAFAAFEDSSLHRDLESARKAVVADSFLLREQRFCNCATERAKDFLSFAYKLVAISPNPCRIVGFANSDDFKVL